ncbi:hypothetical protein D3C76_1429850 [compost metagenome]
MDDQGIHVGDVHAGFNNAGADQHIEFPVQEVQDGFLQLLLAHLPVGHRHPRIRHQHGNLVGNLLDALDPVVQVVHLAFPGQLPFNGFAG